MIKMNDRNSKTKKQPGACVLPCDFHTHTGFSDDCDVPMEQMVEGAIAHDIETLAITDHYDPGYPDPEFPFQLDFSRYLPALQAVQTKYRDKNRNSGRHGNRHLKRPF